MNPIFNFKQIALKQKVFTALALYELYDKEKDQLIGTIKENFSYHTIFGFLPYLSDFKGFELVLYDDKGNIVQYYKRNMGINSPVKTFDNTGKLLSNSKLRLFNIRPEIMIFDANNQEIATVRGNITARELEIFSTEKKLLCKIARPFLPPELLKLKYKQLFHINFQEIDPFMKQQIFGILPSLDQFFWEG